ncbi:MAG TPA: acyl carrier protein [Lactovum miscens]|uniref:acyl carrier protein n=1 Tax=Lactovum miscens TaxID=190387 RepID=UPI002EDBA085
MIEELFKGIVEENELKEMILHTSKYLETEIVSLGVDSLALMELVLRIEDLLGQEIDFDTFDIDSVSTVGKIISLISESKD